MKNGISKAPGTSRRNGHVDAKDPALRTSELRYRRLFESAQDGILILDGEAGEIIDANPFLLDLLNFQFREIIGLKLWEIGQFKDIAANKEAFQKLQDNQYIRYEDLPLVARGGKKIQVEFVSNVYLVDNRKIIQCNIRDISVRAKVQEASRAHLSALELASNAKDEFLAALSHELRTPLGAISSMLDLFELEQNLKNAPSLGEDPSDLDDSGVALIRRNVQILVTLINELLDLTHISRGDIPLELVTLDAHHEIGDALRDLSAQVKAKRLDLRVNLRAEFRHVKVDRAKFHRIITNLVGNAIKFTPIDGTVRVNTTNASNDDLVLEISDSGIGIEAGSISRIFSPFEQGDPSVRRRFGGLGLGLSISKSLAKAHGATLTAESEGRDNGATFTLRCKTVQMFPGEVGPESKIDRGAPLRILLVEDNADGRKCLHRLLQSGGHNVFSAADARGAVELSEGEEFDLLITDIGLPDRSGFELWDELRQRKPDLLAIALSGCGMPNDVAKSKEAGFSEHFIKPVNLQELHAAIDKLTPGKAATRKR